MLLVGLQGENSPESGFFYDSNSCFGVCKNLLFIGRSFRLFDQNDKFESAKVSFLVKLPFGDDTFNHFRVFPIKSLLIRISIDCIVEHSGTDYFREPKL